jgi:hypothetical protein
VAVACSAIALPIMANHGMIPGSAAALIGPAVAAPTATPSSDAA